jgi:hypothetical protein
MAMRRNGAVVVLPCFSLAMLALLTGGCTSTHVTRAARFEPAQTAQAVRGAPQAGAYKVKYADVSGGGLRTVGGTQRIVGRGDPLGFTRSPEGKVVAVAGDEQIALEKLPPTARYCVWIAKDQRQTQFSREVGKAAAIAGAGVVVGALAGVEVLGALAESDNDNCDDSSDAGRNRHRRHHEHGKSYRWVGADGGQGKPGQGQGANDNSDDEP